MSKSRLCEVLGAEIGEVFTFHGVEYCIYDAANGIDGDENETVVCKYDENLKKYIRIEQGFIICKMINHADDIIHKPKWNKEEIEKAKAIRQLYPTAKIVRRIFNRDKLVDIIFENMEDGDKLRKWIMVANDNLFPSLKQGEEVELDEILKSEEVTK